MTWLHVITRCDECRRTIEEYVRADRDPTSSDCWFCGSQTIRRVSVTELQPISDDTRRAA